MQGLFLCARRYWILEGYWKPSNIQWFREARRASLSTSCDAHLSVLRRASASSANSCRRGLCQLRMREPASVANKPCNANCALALFSPSGTPEVGRRARMLDSTGRATDIGRATWNCPRLRSLSRSTIAAGALARDPRRDR